MFIYVEKIILKLLNLFFIFFIEVLVLEVIYYRKFIGAKESFVQEYEIYLNVQYYLILVLMLKDSFIML